jgi:hypothetical protein
MASEVLLIFLDGTRTRWPEVNPTATMIVMSASGSPSRWFRLTDKIDDETGLHIYEEQKADES